MSTVPGEDGNDLADLLGPFWTEANVREALDVLERQSVASLSRNGTILGVRAPTETRSTH